MAGLNQEALTQTLLPSLKREYTLNEIATMTRSAAARLMGLHDRGSLAPGCVADIAAYTPQNDISVMFAQAKAVFKSGVQVVKDGEVINTPRGSALYTLPAYDRKHVDHSLRDYYKRYMTVQTQNLCVEPGFSDATGGERFVKVPVLTA
jgi:formylmethanofuran dehydrogenase subunit A